MSSVLGITFDCVDTSVVAQFWSDALGGEIIPAAPTDAAVLGVDMNAGPLRLSFRKVAAGKFYKNRVRLHLATDNFDLEGARLLSLGAVRLNDIASFRARWTTFADVEGNEFDLIEMSGKDCQ